MADLSATFRRPFKQQVAAFRLRLGNLVPTERWDDIERSAHDTAFMVAGANKADLLADLGAAVDKAETEGTSLDEFRRDFREIVTRRGWHGWTGEGTKAGEAWRTRVIYRTNMATSYAAGRMAQLREGNFKFWVYRHGGSVEPRPQHLAWDGLVLPPDHPFWATHGPPNGWGCSCYILGARSEAGARRLGGDPGKPLPDGWQVRDPRTGAPPGIDRGWDYTPGASVSHAVSAIADKLVKIPALTGAELLKSWPGRLFEEWADAFGEFVDDALGGPPRGRVMMTGALKPEWIRAAARRGVTPSTADIAVTDRAVLHAFRDVKRHPLPVDWYKRLPVHLRTPDIVLLDNTRPGAPAFLLYLPIPDSTAKLVVAVNYNVKGKGVFNIISTGARVEVRDIRERIGSGAQVIEGGV